MRPLDQFSRLLFDTCEKFQEENNLTVHKIVIEDTQMSFEIWMVGKSNKPGIKRYSYQKPKKKTKNNKK